MIKVGILTISDKGSRGEREDLSGKVIEEIVKKINGEVKYYQIVPDEKDIIQEELIKAVDKLHLDLILTTGGTGLGKRDVTPEATSAIIEKEVPGISEIIRSESFKKINRAILSRGMAGIRKESLIINLPGSPKGVKESLEIILEALPHG
ncbi:unnamed protein product, partial [marine sediment metagenome]